MTSFLRADSLRVKYGQLEVLKGVSFEVSQGETFAIIGPNGAGKTTLFKAMTGEVKCESGRVFFGGEDITDLPPYKRARNGFGRTFQVARVFQELTTLSNVMVSIESRYRSEGLHTGPWYECSPAAVVADEAKLLLKDLGLYEFRDAEARFLSHGDRKRLEFALTLAMRPKLMMLDEPTAGMAHVDRLSIVELIKRIQSERGMTVILTEHDMDVVFGLSARLMVLNYGEIIATGSAEEVRQNSLVREVYLGKEMIGA